MKAVMLSIQPQWCSLIAKGKKSLEVRKSRPTLETPFKVYIYCTKTPGLDAVSGKVVGEFICDKIERVGIPYPAYADSLDKRFIEQSVLSYWALHGYAFHDDLFFWHISYVKLYDVPCDIKDFTALRKTRFGMMPVNVSRPPQSWIYVEERTAW